MSNGAYAPGAKVGPATFIISKVERAAQTTTGVARQSLSTFLGPTFPDTGAGGVELVAIISGTPGPALFDITMTGSVRSSGLDQDLRGLDGEPQLGVGGDLTAQGVADPAWRTDVPL